MLLNESGEDVSQFQMVDSDMCEDQARRQMVVSRDLFYVRVCSLLEYFAIRASVLEIVQEMDEEPRL